MRSNMLVISTISVDSEWSDKDFVLLHAAFQILVDFVEKEWIKPDGEMTIETLSAFTNDVQEFHREWLTSCQDQPRHLEATQQQIETEQALLRLYAWWKFERKEDDDEQAKLEELIKYRCGMWT